MELLDRYEKLKQKVVERKDSFNRFLGILESETTWLISPASTRFHLAEERGLLKHSVGVAETLLRFREFLAPAISEESCVIVGLLHDVGKLGMPGKPLYLPNENEWMVKNRGIRYKINPEVVDMGLAVRSLSIVAIIEPVFFAVMKPAQRAQKQSWTPLSKRHFHLLFGVNILLFLRQ